MEVLELEETVEQQINDFKLRKGRLGEQIIENNINNNIDIYQKIIRNVILTMDGKKTELDIILITCVGIFIIESKNFKGYIYGNDSHKKWTQVISKEKHNTFENPVLQNQYHIDFISNNLSLDPSYFHSYIVFGDEAKLENITISDNHVKVINNKDLIENLIMDIHDEDIKISLEQIDKMYIDLKYFYSRIN